MASWFDRLNVDAAACVFHLEVRHRCVDDVVYRLLDGVALGNTSWEFLDPRDVTTVESCLLDLHVQGHGFRRRRSIGWAPASEQIGKGSHRPQSFLLVPAIAATLFVLVTAHLSYDTTSGEVDHALIGRREADPVTKRSHGSPFFMRKACRQRSQAAPRSPDAATRRPRPSSP
jgi:hypothetical protein